MLVLAVNIHLFNNIRVLKRAGYPLGLFINVIAVSLSLTHLVIHTPVTSSSPVDSPLSSSISLPQSFTPGLKPNCFTNPFHHRLSSSPGLTD